MKELARLVCVLVHAGREGLNPPVELLCLVKGLAGPDCLRVDLLLVLLHLRVLLGDHRLMGSHLAAVLEYFSHDLPYSRCSR